MKETTVSIRGRRSTLWSAVDDTGRTIDILAQRRRNPRSAERLLRSLQGEPGIDTFTKRVFTGYQGWFATPKDSVLNRWKHWSKRGMSAPRIP